MAAYETVVPGLPGEPLGTSYPIAFNVVPLSMPLNRPGYKARYPRRSVLHGHDHLHAAAIAQDLRNGAPDVSGKPRQVSYHAASDDVGVWCVCPSTK